MSYILDALRKADAERDRGNVPGIHTQPSFGPIPVSGSPAAARPWLWLGGGALGMTLLGAVAWTLWGDAPRTTSAVTANTVPSAAPAPLPTPAPAPTPAPSPPPVAAARPAPEPAVRKPRPAAPAAPTAPAAATAAQPVPMPAQATAPPGPTASAARIYAVGELPEEIRRQLPSLNLGGAMYSATPANRIVIVNGLVLHEGDRVAPELVLEQIRQKGAVLSFRGYRYAVGF